MTKLTLILTALMTLPLSHAGTLNTFTLPAVNSCQGLYYPDLPASFPNVNFDELDRLYIQAGHYKFIRLANLPDKLGQSPLVITNSGGQVRVGGCGHYYNFNIGGGKNWHLTGQYDPVAETGHSDYRGHGEGQYAHSYDTYGFLIDADFGDGNIGLSVGGGASDFEVSFVEARNLEFAGMMFKTDNDGNAHMNNVKIHDNYIHDTISEGIYLGSTQSQPQHKFSNLEIYNNRVIRTGTEIGQFGNLADGTRIHHNVFILGALDWKNPFQQFQDSGIQLGHREGSMSFDHNIVMGAASNAMIVFNPDVVGDAHDPADVFSINNNYIAYSRNRGVYIHSSSDGIKQVEFDNNYFSQIDFSYDEVYNSNDELRIIKSANNDSPINLSNNLYDNQPGQGFYLGSSNITANNNQIQNIAQIPFHNLGWPGNGDYFTLEVWTATDINGQTVEYLSGDLAIHQGEIYTAQRDLDYASDPQLSPDTAPSSDWLLAPRMADDVRQLETSPFVDLGLLDVVTDLIYADGFE